MVSSHLPRLSFAHLAFHMRKDPPLRLVISHILLLNVSEARLTERPKWSLVSNKPGVSQMIHWLTPRLIIASVSLVQYLLHYYISV